MSLLSLKQPHGVRDMFLAASFFAGTNFCVKWLNHLPFFQLAFFRALFALIFCWLFMRAYKIPLMGTGKKRNRRWLWARGVAGTAALSIFFYTVHVLPLATAVTLQYLAPIFTIIIAGFLLGEKAKPLQWLFFALAFAGVVFIRGFESDGIAISHILIALTGAVGSALAYNFIRVLKTEEHPMVVIFFFPLVTVPILLGPTVYYWQTPAMEDLPALFGVGFFTQIAQWFMTRAYQNERAEKVVIVNYVGVVFAFLLGYFVFGEVLTTSALCGILLIVLAVAANTLYSAHQRAN